MSWQRTRARSALDLPMLSLVLTLSLGAAGVATEAADPVSAGSSAVFTLNVPTDAVVQFDGVEMRLLGTPRRFETPPLAPGRKYGYDVSVTWTEGIQTVVRKRHVTFRAGQRLTLNFGPAVPEDDGGGLMEDPAAPDPSGTAYNENPLNWPVYPGRPGSGQGSPARLPTQAGIRVLVPADAEVFFNGERTTQKGSERLFITPPLQAGKKYHYDLLARWKEDGKAVEQKRRVDVSAGANVRVDFRTPPTKGKTKPGE